MPAAEDNAKNAYHDGNEKSTDKEIGGDCEGKTSIAHAAEIEDRDDDQNADAERNCVRQQGGNGRDQGANSCGNAYCGCEDVIGKERGRGKQPGRCAQIKARHGVGATAGGIGGNGLTIGKVHDHQQGDNGGANRNDVTHAEKAKGNEKAEGRFRAISSRAKRVQAKDRDALRRTNLLGTFVARLNRLADDEVKDVHRRSSPIDCSHSRSTIF